MSKRLFSGFMSPIEIGFEALRLTNTKNTAHRINEKQIRIEASRRIGKTNLLKKYIENNG